MPARNTARLRRRDAAVAARCARVRGRTPVPHAAIDYDARTRQILSESHLARFCCAFVRKDGIRASTVTRSQALFPHACRAACCRVSSYRPQSRPSAVVNTVDMDVWVIVRALP